MFLLIDNYDSFTYNLWHFLGQLGADVRVVRNDKITAKEALELEPEGIIISPGPCDPDKAGISLEVIETAPKNLPIFGVCLGHQCIGRAFGSKIIRSKAPIHGKISIIKHHLKLKKMYKKLLNKRNIETATNLIQPQLNFFLDQLIKAHMNL